jgi:hypothetical protein
MRLLATFLIARPGNAAPEAVGIDMSIMQLLRSVRLPEEVARDADDGKMMCRPEWFEMPMFLAAEKLGLRREEALGRAISSL